MFNLVFSQVTVNWARYSRIVVQVQNAEKYICFIDLVEIVNDQFNKNAA